jgi:hypothetical protein
MKKDSLKPSVFLELGKSKLHLEVPFSRPLPSTVVSGQVQEGGTRGRPSVRNRRQEIEGQRYPNPSLCRRGLPYVSGPISRIELRI